jgi:hypothetical protein
METIIIINEQHSLLAEQREILTDKFGEWETLLVPAEGWDKKERDKICENLEGKQNIIFISPIPGMIKRLSAVSGYVCAQEKDWGKPTLTVSVFANDRREKKELPNGKVISITSQTGWYLE